MHECLLGRPRREGAVQVSSSGVRSIVVGKGGGRQFCGRKFNEESRSRWKIVLDMDAAAVFGHDAGGDGEAESGSAVLGREMRQEEFVLVLRRNTGAGVRDTDYNGLRIRSGFGGNQDFP